MKFVERFGSGLTIALSLGLSLTAAYAQSALDRVDPAEVTERLNLPSDVQERPAILVEPTAPPAVATRVTPVVVGAVVIQGAERLTPGQFSDIAAESVGRTLDGEDLALLADAIARRARDLGYIFASARVLPQRLQAGVLIVTLDEGRIDEVRIDGAQNAAIFATLAPLVGNGPVRQQDVERRLLLAGDIGGVQVRNARYVREGDRSVLHVQTVRDSHNARATIDNSGTRPVGREQLQVDMEVFAPFFEDDALSLTYVTSVVDFEELQVGRAEYTKRVDTDGSELRLSGSFSATRPGAYLEAADIEGQSWFLSLLYSRPLLRRRDASIWLNASVDLRDGEQRRAGRLVRDDRIAAVRIGAYAFADAAGGRARSELTVSRGLDILGATRGGDPLASRRDVEVDFTTVQLWADWTGDVVGPFSVRFAVKGQISSEPLLIAEDMGLGGTAFLRAYDYSERSGDGGVQGLGELRFDVVNPLRLARRLQLYTYLDGGEVWNLEDGRGSGSLASVGGGLRTAITRTFHADLAVAVPLSGPGYDTDDEDPRVRFRVSKSF